MSGLSYHSRLKALNLESLELRRLRDAQCIVLIANHTGTHTLSCHATFSTKKHAINIQILCLELLSFLTYHTENHAIDGQTTDDRRQTDRQTDRQTETVNITITLLCPWVQVTMDFKSNLNEITCSQTESPVVKSVAS